MSLSLLFSTLFLLSSYQIGQLCLKVETGRRKDAPRALRPSQLTIAANQEPVMTQTHHFYSQYPATHPNRTFVTQPPTSSSSLSMMAQQQQQLQQQHASFYGSGDGLTPVGATSHSSSSSLLPPPPPSAVSQPLQPFQPFQAQHSEPRSAQFEVFAHPFTKTLSHEYKNLKILPHFFCFGL